MNFSYSGEEGDFLNDGGYPGGGFACEESGAREVVEFAGLVVGEESRRSGEVVRRVRVVDCGRRGGCGWGGEGEEDRGRRGRGRSRKREKSKKHRGGALDNR